MRSMAMPRRSHQTESLERLNKALGLAKGTPLSERMAAGRPRSANSCWKACRDLMRLKLQGRSFPEIQKIMGASAINTVYTWDHRCRKHLLELMGGDWEPKR